MRAFGWICILVLAGGSALGDDSENAKNSPFKELKYRSIGPAAGGRVCRVAGVPGDPLVYYAATAGSGVWKSTNGGIDWKPIFDDQTTASAGSIAVAPSDPNVVYVGAGEANIRSNVQVGDGIYKSTDAGKTWKHVWKQRGQIGAMVVHPSNPDVAYAAVLGHAFGPNNERGVYRTTDGGKSWHRVLHKDADTGASEVAIDPNNPRIVFAGLWQARRRPWTLTSGGPGSGLHVSRDGGDTWKELTESGLPPKPWGKVGVAVAPSDSRRVYAIIEAEKGGLFRSDDGGSSWSKASDDRVIRQRAWYYSTVTIDPSNPDVVWAPQVPLVKSIDGGKTFNRVGGTHHGDHHDVWIDPKNPKRIIECNDGGVDVTSDGGETWFAPQLPIAQFYRVNTDTRTPYHVSGTMQDLGAVGGPSNSLGSGGIRPDDWYDIGGGEAGYTLSDPTDPLIVYAGEYDGIFTRIDLRTGASRHIGVYPYNGSGHGAEDKKYRFRWPAPAAGSPHDPKTVYHGGNVLFRTTDGGQTWTALGGDLTRNDRTKQKWAGGPITGDNTGAEYYCTLSAIAESPKQKGLIWTGSDDGLVHMTKDDGKTWTNVTGNIEDFPEWATIQHVEPSYAAPGTAFVAVDAHMMDDQKPYIWKTIDFGATWKPIVAGIPVGVSVHVVREDPTDPNLLYAGTDLGVVYSKDGGDHWQSLQLNLPSAAVHDIRVKDRDLVLATMGRSLWILDDLTPIRASVKPGKDPVVLHQVAPTTRWNFRSSPRRKGGGDNPPNGAILHYYLEKEHKDGVKLEILDAKGAVFAEIHGKPDDKPKGGGEDDEDDDDDDDEDEKKPVSGKAGLHRVVWNFRGTEPVKIPKAKIDAGNLGVGPLAVPGGYTVRLTVDKETRVSPLMLKPDPRSTVKANDLIEQSRFATAIRDDVTRLSKSVLRIRSLMRQVKQRNTALKDVDAAKAFVKASTGIVEKLDAFENRLHNPKAKVVYDILAFKGGAKLYSQFSALYSFSMDGEGAPTQGMKEVYATLRRELDAVLADFEKFLGSDLAANQRDAKAHDWPTVFVPPAGAGGSRG